MRLARAHWVRVWRSVVVCAELQIRTRPEALQRGHAGGELVDRHFAGGFLDRDAERDVRGLRQGGNRRVDAGAGGGVGGAGGVGAEGRHARVGGWDLASSVMSKTDSHQIVTGDVTI